MCVCFRYYMCFLFPSWHDVMIPSESHQTNRYWYSDHDGTRPMKQLDLTPISHGELGEFDSNFTPWPEKNAGQSVLDEDTHHIVGTCCCNNSYIMLIYHDYHDISLMLAAIPKAIFVT